MRFLRDKALVVPCYADTRKTTFILDSVCTFGCTRERVSDIARHWRKAHRRARTTIIRREVPSALCHTGCSVRQFARETPRPASEKRTAIGAAGAGRPSRRRCSGCPWPEPSCSEGKPLGGQAPGRPRRRSRHGRRRAARCPGAGHWSVAPSSHSVHRWPSMGRLSYRSPRALAPHCLVEADTCEQRARHAHSRRRRGRPRTPAAETNRRVALHRGAQPVEDLARSAAGRIAAARPQLLEGCGTRAQLGACAARVHGKVWRRVGAVQADQG